MFRVGRAMEDDSGTHADSPVLVNTGNTGSVAFQWAYQQRVAENLSDVVLQRTRSATSQIVQRFTGFLVANSKHKDELETSK
jgi:phosphoribosylamine-glycine ligase